MNNHAKQAVLADKKKASREASWSSASLQKSIGTIFLVLHPFFTKLKHQMHIMEICLVRAKISPVSCIFCNLKAVLCGTASFVIFDNFESTAADSSAACRKVAVT